MYEITAPSSHTIVRYPPLPAFLPKLLDTRGSKEKPTIAWIVINQLLGIKHILKVNVFKSSVISPKSLSIFIKRHRKTFHQNYDFLPTRLVSTSIRYGLLLLASCPAGNCYPRPAGKWEDVSCSWFPGTLKRVGIYGVGALSKGILGRWRGTWYGSLKW